MRQELLQAWRTIARAPVVSLVVVLSLAAGIGMNTVVFSWMHARMIRPLPGVPDSHRFLGVEAKNDTGYPASSFAEYLDLRTQLTSFSELIASRMNPIYIGRSGETERVYGLFISDNYFRALGIRPVAGEFPDPARLARGRSEPVAVIGYGLWQARFGGSRDAIGTLLRVSAVDMPIVAVTPEDFQGTVLGLNFELFVPADAAPLVNAGTRELEDRGIRGYTLLGKLRDGISRETAQAEASAVMAALGQAYPASNTGVGIEIGPFWNSPRGPQRLMVRALWLLQGIMLVVLAAVCGNTANLLLARTSARHKEMGVRLALGSPPARIVRLVLLENVLLGIGGAIGGALIAWWGARALRVIPLTGLPIKMVTELETWGVLVAMLLGVIAGLAVGAPSAVQLARLDAQAALREASRTAGRSRFRSALMAVQTALGVAVLIAAGLFIRTFLETKTADPGFRREGVLLAAYDLSGRNLTSASIKAFHDRLLSKVRSLPSVQRAAIASSIPLDIHGLPMRVFTLDGRTRTEAGFDQALTNVVTPGYFGVLDIPLVAGSDFVPLTDTSAPAQAIVNEEFVRRYAGGGEVLGRALQARGGRYVIAGVVRNSLYNAFGEPPTPMIYFSYRDRMSAAGEIHVRARRGAETSIAADLRGAVRELDPELPLFNVRTLTAHVETNLVFRTIPARMFIVLGPMLLALAGIGIYAVVAYSVSLRSREIGLRIAIGASHARVVWDVIGQTMKVIVAGAAAGTGLALFAASRMPPSANSMDPVIFTLVPLVLVSVAAIACWLPAWRAAWASAWLALRD